MDELLSRMSSELQLLPRLGAALVLGGLVGWERESADRPAGLRTHMLVAVGSALLMLFTDLMVERYEDDSNASIDPLRVSQAIVAGISFIGAGTIFVSGEKHRVRGLTTAASLFVVAAIGIGCGMGLYFLSIVVAVSVAFVLRFVGWFEEKHLGRSNRLSLDETPADDSD